MEIASLHRKFVESGKVSTDTRQITAGCLFFALKGPNFDANALAQQALDLGARYAVIDDAQYAVDDRFILTDDCLKTLQALAGYHRDTLNIPVIGLTGSNGKTTSKELLHAVLSRKYMTSATKGNLNNHIGVPLTLLEIADSIEIAVVEMGANHVGEIAELCRIAKPTHGFITNIGRAHIGTFGGAENILRAKSELYQHLLLHRGTVFINSQNPMLSSMAKRFSDPVFYPSVGDFYHCTLSGSDPFVNVLAENGTEIATRLTGTYNFENIAAALCIGKFFGVPAAQANAAIAEYAPGNMRSQIIVKNTNRIILDAYNANPSSMEAAIINLAAMKSERKVAILGDMYELGDDAGMEHRNLGSVINENHLKDVYLCGILVKAVLEVIPDAKYFETLEQLITFLKDHPITNATILVKASRGMKIEKVLDVL